MTREEVIDRLIEAKKNLTDEVIDMAIKALEQESCGDAISRQETIEAFQMFRGYEANRTNAEWVDRIETVVKKLPPVKPQKPKTGHWIDTGEPNEIWDERYICSECKFDMVGSANYCPTCGARMESEVEV